MIDLRKLEELVHDEPSWKRYIDQLHEDAGLDVYDDTLVHAALTDLKASILEAIFETRNSGFLRHSVLEMWRAEKETTAGATAVAR